MKQLSLLLLTLVVLSCSKRTEEELLLKVHELRNKVISLSNERDKLIDSTKFLTKQNDSLSNIALRWKYGRDSHRYADDFIGGNSMSWRWACSLYQLKFDTYLLDKNKIEASDDSEFKYDEDVMQDLLNNDVSPTYSKFTVDIDFEADRFNYLISTLIVNVYAEQVRRKAARLFQREGLVSAQSGYIDVVMGLLYKKMYNSIKDYDKSYETLKDLFEQFEEYGFEIL